MQPASRIQSYPILDMIKIVAFLSMASSLALAGSAFDNGPIIGILGVPASNCVTFREASRAWKDKPTDADSCVGYYYAGFLEAAGARVVGIPYNLSETQLEEVLTGLSGVLFTGGGLNLQPSTSYFNTALRVYDFIVRRNTKDGVYVPLHGTCMGFQLISILAANDTGILDLNAFDSEDLSLPLDLTDAGRASSSWLASELPSQALDTLTGTNCTSNLHHDGVPPSAWKQVSRLASTLEILSTNKDRQGKEFVSTLQARDPSLPITATQWHPERPQFEWNPDLGINHSADSVDAMAAVARMFVRRARKSPQRLTSEFQQSYARAHMATGMHREVFGDPAWAEVELWY